MSCHFVLFIYFFNIMCIETFFILKCELFEPILYTKRIEFFSKVVKKFLVRESFGFYFLNKNENKYSQIYTFEVYLNFTTFLTISKRIYWNETSEISEKISEKNACHFVLFKFFLL